MTWSGTAFRRSIDLPAWYNIHMMLMEAESGGLGLAGLKGSSLHLWCRPAGRRALTELTDGNEIL
jgi:hypothetical protein